MTTPPAPPTGVRAFVDSQPIGRRQRIIVLMVFLMMVADGMDITLASHLFPPVIRDWGVPVSAVTLVVSLGVVAMAIGALVSGPVADRWGRKGVTVVGFVLFCLATAGLGLTGDIHSFAALRIISCFGLGAVMPVALTIVADWVPKARRAQMVSIAFAGVGLGSIIGAYLAAAVIPTLGWQVMVLIAGLTPLIILPFFVVLVPEPAIISVRRGIPEARIRSALALVAPDRDIAGVDLTRAGLTLGAGEVRAKALFAEILSRPLLGVTLLIWVVFFVVQGSGLLVLQYMPMLLQAPAPGLSTVESGLIVAMYGWGALIGQLAIAFIFKRFDRFIVLAAFTFWSVVGLLIVAAFGTGFGFFGYFTLMFAIGLSLPATAAAMQSITTLAYPEEFRATGMGSAGFAGRLGTLTYGALGGTLIGAGFGITTVSLVLAAPLAVSIGLTFSLRALSRRAGIAAEPQQITPGNEVDDAHAST